MVYRSLLALRRKLFWAGFLLLLPSSSSFAQRVDVRSQVNISPTGGWYPWYEVAGNPTDPSSLIVCGTRWDARDNAFYGFVFSSSDGGKTWHTSLEDKNSTWVTEQSCAFGMNGKVYFVSEASKVIDGIPNHDLGTTRIFASNDAGRSWVEATRTTWADYSASAVDTQPGPNRNRLYVFYDDVYFKDSEVTSNKPESVGSRVSVMGFKEGEEKVRPPITNASMGNLRYQGSYPQKAFVLKDGSLLGVYFARLKTENGRNELIDAVRLERDRLVLSDPVIVASTSMDNIQGCYPEDFAAAYDPSGDRVFVAYHAFADGQCRFILKTSTDAGRTWSKGHEIRRPETMSRGFYSPAMAVDSNGIVGLMWRDEPVSDCWYFSASVDSGGTFGPARPLSRCFGKGPVSLTRSDASLRMAGTVSANHDSSKSLSSAHHALGLQIVDSRNHAWRNLGSLIATNEGIFHAVWIELGHGEGQLRTAAVTVDSSEKLTLPPLPLEEADALDISENMAILYGGVQHYDISSGTLSVDILLKNKSKESIKAPLLLKAVTLSGELGRLEIANASNGVSGPGAIWDLSKAVPNGLLEPGDVTRPYSLVFLVPNDEAPAGETEVLASELMVLACRMCDKPRR